MINQVTQQYCLRACYYNPLVGRFTQEDVYRGDGLNLYAYCGNNPVMYVDSSGYSKQCEIGSESGRNSNIVYRAVTPEQAKSIRAGNGIDLNNILDISTTEKATQHLTRPFTINAAAYHQEVLIYGDIPQEAITGFVGGY